jgi:hypothetical protein
VAVDVREDVTDCVLVREADIDRELVLVALLERVRWEVAEEVPVRLELRLFLALAVFVTVALELRVPPPLREPDVVALELRETLALFDCVGELVVDFDTEDVVVPVRDAGAVRVAVVVAVAVRVTVEVFVSREDAVELREDVEVFVPILEPVDVKEGRAEGVGGLDG